MRKADFDKVAGERPFRPFEVRLVDGRVYRFKSPEGFVVSPTAVFTLDAKGEVLVISLGLVATLHQLPRNGNGKGHRGSK